MKITLGSIVSYVVGIPLLFIGIVLTSQSPLGLLPLVGGLLIIPIIRRQIEGRTGIELSRGATAGIGSFSVIGGIIILLIVAPTGDVGSPPGNDVSNVSMTAEGVDPTDAATDLEVTWNSRAQSAVDPDPDDMSIYNTEDGQKFLVVRMTIQNTGDERIDLNPRLFRAESGGVEYEYQPLFGSGNSFNGVTLNPDASYTAWTAYSVPDDTAEAKLIVNQEAYYQKNVSVSFSHDSNMEINMSD